MAVQLEERSRDILENRQPQECADIESAAFEPGSNCAAIGQRSRGARDHTFAAGNTGRATHGQIVVEGDAGLIPFAAARQHPVVANIIATTYATVTQDAGFMIDGNCQR